MTVKPPGGPGGVPPIPPEPTPVAGPESKQPFSLEGAELPRVSPDLAADVAGRVRDGSMTVEQAVESIVDRTLSDPAVAALGAERIAALREILRAAVAEDPVLAQLAGQIAR